MRRARGPFYRTAFVRVFFILSGVYISWLLSPWGPDAIRTYPALLWLHRLIPWWVMSSTYLIYTVLMVWGRLRGVIFADFIGAAFWTVMLVGFVATARLDVRWLAFPTILAFVVLHIAASRLAMYEQSEKERRR